MTRERPSLRHDRAGGIAAGSMLHLASIAMVLVLLAMPLVPRAQPAAKVYRIGLLSPTPQQAGIEPFREGLRTLGYVEGHNVVIEHRSADGRFERLPDLAAELVGLKVDVIVAVVTQASLAAKNATKTIPIVMIGVADPIGSGLVTSLARPGGNVTGTSYPVVEVAGKSLEVLKEVIPKLHRVAALWNPANSVFQAQMVNETEAAARALSIQLRLHRARDADEINAAFEVIAKERPEALTVIADPVFVAHRTKIATLAAKSHLPSVSTFNEYADAGGLITYAPSFLEPGARAAAQVDKIFRGAKPADLPVERATKFALILNAKTAKILGLTIPPSVSARADRIIQ
jgi:putative tryptophan/tyrosine transport system substrate-binding protein